jgi:DNA-binding MarR family transcriptional regulator
VRADPIDEIRAQWRAERPELDTTAMGVVGRLLRVARLAEDDLALPLRERGLHDGWLDVLAALRRSGRPYELNPKCLQENVMLSSGGMTKRIDGLERAGLVERRPDPRDRRGTFVRLTSSGKRLIDRTMDAHLANEERLLEALGAAEVRTLDKLLRKLLLALETNP